MAPDPLIEEDEQYASSEDSDFAPDAVPDQASDHSDTNDDDDDGGNEKPPAKRSLPAGDGNAVDADYDNSGDEAIIAKGVKRQRKAKTKGVTEDDEEGGEGGLIKTRRQRAAEKEERKYTVDSRPVTVDVDALWEQMLAGTSTPTAKPDESQKPTQDDDGPEPAKEASLASDDEPSTMIRIKRTYNFAGRVHTEEKLVPRDSAEAKLFLASQGGQPEPAEDSAPKRVTRKAFRSAFEPLTDILPSRGDLNLGMAARIQAGKEAQAKKLNTVEKSRMDWAGYVDKAGIQDELALAGKSKTSYNAREDFLARSEARREEDSRRARMSGRV